MSLWIGSASAGARGSSGRTLAEPLVGAPLELQLVFLVLGEHRLGDRAVRAKVEVAVAWTPPIQAAQDDRLQSCHQSVQLLSPQGRPQRATYLAPSETCPASAARTLAAPPRASLPTVVPRTGPFAVRAAALIAGISLPYSTQHGQAPAHTPLSVSSSVVAAIAAVAGAVAASAITAFRAHSAGPRSGGRMTST
jgi:hypothetical protein